MANYTYPSIPAKLQHGDTVRFNYTGSVQQWNPQNNGVSKLKVECRGAAGASTPTSGSLKATRGGNGGYSSGIISGINSNLFFCSGRIGVLNSSSRVFGGGGTYGGGGCTWIAKQANPTSKSHLYIVAGGGGAGSGSYGGSEHGGAGGGLNGQNSICGSYSLPGGKQNSVGTNSITTKSDGAGFLLGGNSYYNSGDPGGGGGAGLYGGRGSNAWGDASWTASGGGGSSYIDGVENGLTYDGTTSYGNTSNGYIIVTVLEDATNISITVKDKKPVYHAPEPVIFTVNSNKSIARLDVMFEDLVIKSFQNPTIDDSVEYTVDVSHELFLNGSNGTNYVKWVCYDANENELHTHVEKYNKYSNEMTIITEPILIGGPELAVDLNLDLTYIEHNDNIKIFVCNNAYDDEPTWEDVTARILNKLNILTINKTKTNENWGLSFKIEVTGPFELSEDFIGGFYVHGFDTPPTLAPEQQDEPNVYRNTPWGTYLHKQASMETEKEILLMELSEDIGVLSSEEKDMDHYKELYEKGFITETQFNRIMKINK